MTSKIVMTLVALAAVTTLAACNTVKGLGKDIQSVGQAGSRAIK